MSRSLIFAILALALFLLGNLIVYSHLSFRYLSERMVTEKLVEGLNEAMSVLNQASERAAFDSPRALTRRLAPRLRKYRVFQAIVVVDATGRVVHRETIDAQITLPAQPAAVNSDSNRLAPRGMIAVRNPSAQTGLESDGESPRLMLEYNAEAIRQEAQNLRSEFERILRLVIIVSAVVLAFGGAYIARAYRRNKQLALANRQADRMAYVGTLSSGLAHEIRNPLNAMNMNVQLIQEELDELGLREAGHFRELLEGVRNEIQRLELMVSSFLAYARPMQLQLKKCQLNELIEATLQFLDPEIQQSGIVLETKLDPKLPEVSVDAGQIRQALINVIQNGVQVLQPGQKLEVATRKAGGDKALIVIRDEGPGMAEEELKNIFKVFYSSKRGGTGLGLPTAQRIAEMHFGGIKVESEVGKGAAFTFILPIEREKP